MSTFAGLVRKEVRDHVAVIAVCAALVPAVSWPAQHWIFKYAEPVWTAEFLVPCLSMLFVLLLASDLFAQDVTTRRMDAFALLPVPLRTHWTARVTFLAGSGAALAAWTWTVQATLLALFAKPGTAGEFLASAGESLLGFSGVALVGAGALLCTAMGVGGLRAALFGAGLAIIAGVSAALLVLAGGADTYPSNSLRFREPALVPILVATGVLVVAAYVAFVRGRPHAASRRHVLACGLAPVLLLVVPGAAVAGVELHRRYTLTPGAANVDVRSISPSPDGRYLALVVAPADDWTGSERTWIVRVEDGALFHWASRGEQLGGWTDDGLVATWSRRTVKVGGEEVADDLPVRNPESGDVVREWSVADWNAGKILYPHPQNGWMRWNGWPGKGEGVWSLAHRDGTGYEPVFSRGMPTACAEDGVVLRVTETGALVRTDLVARTDVTLVASGVKRAVGWTAFSPDRRYVLVELEAGHAALDTTTWSVAAGPWKTTTPTWSYAAGAAAVLVLREENGGRVTSALDLSTKRETPFGPGVGDPMGDVAPLPGGRIAVARGSDTVDLLEPDGTLVRRLYPPAK